MVEIVDDVVVEEAPPVIEAEGYEFDFSLITAGDANEFRRLTLRMQTSNAIGVIAGALLNPPVDFDVNNLGQLKFKIAKAIMDAFLSQSRLWEGAGSNLFSFDVEDVVIDDVEQFMIASHNGQVSKQVEIMNRYRNTNKAVSDSEFLVLDYATYLDVRSAFLDRLLDLTKN